MRKMVLVCTTIGDGGFMDGYCAAAKEFDRDNVEFILIPDIKTKFSFWVKVRNLLREGWHVTAPIIDMQESFLKKVGMMGLVPLNSDNRRNIGYLMALEAGAEVVVSIDDDNFRIPGSKFFEEHAKVGHLVSLREHEYSGGWCNVLADLGMPNIYPRGFPYFARNKDIGVGHSQKDEQRFIDVNQGLWKSEPDVDAVTWMVHPTLKVEEKKLTSYLIGQNTWLPINSQNTAVSRKAMVAYYFIPMGGIIDGMRVDRMGDIFQGYFLEACVKACYGGIRVGTPMVDHRRNSHSHMSDLKKELPGIMLLEKLLPWLQALHLTGGNLEMCYAELAAGLDEAAEREDWGCTTTKGYLHQVAFCMRRWLKACRMIG